MNYLKFILSAFLLFNTCSLFTSASRNEPRSKEVLERLNDHYIPQSVTKEIILKYLLEAHHEKEFKNVMLYLLQNDHPSTFYGNDLMIRLRKYFESLSVTHHLNNEFYNDLMKVVAKWILVKRQEYFDNDEFFRNLKAEAVALGKSVVSQVGSSSYHLGNLVDFESDYFLLNYFSMELAEQWESLFSIVKHIYEDFYCNNHTCGYIIEKYFYGNPNNEYLLKAFIDYQNKPEIKKCFESSDPETRVSEIYSKERLEKEIISNLFITFPVAGYFNKDKLKLLIQGGHKIEILKYTNLMKMAYRFDLYYMMTMKNLEDTIVVQSEKLNREKIKKREKTKTKYNKDFLERFSNMLLEEKESKTPTITHQKRKESQNLERGKRSKRN